MTTTTTTTIPSGASVTAQFKRMDNNDTKRIIETVDNGTLSIRRDSAYFGVGLIMANLRQQVESDGGTRITTKMLKDAGIATISKERRRDGEQLVTLAKELNKFINGENAPASMTSVAALLKCYNDFIKSAETSDESGSESDESESDDDAAPMTADEIAAQALTIAKAHDVSAKALVEAIIAQVAPASAAKRNVA